MQAAVKVGEVRVWRRCAGCFTAPAALELYAHVFEAQGALDKVLDALRPCVRGLASRG